MEEQRKKIILNSDATIVKVKKDSIRFNVDDAKYRLISQTCKDGDKNKHKQMLEEFINGKWELVNSGCELEINLKCEYIKHRQDLSWPTEAVVYSQLDLCFFEYQLTKNGFAQGKYDKRLKFHTERIAKYREIEEQAKIVGDLETAQKAHESVDCSERYGWSWGWE